MRYWNVAPAKYAKLNTVAYPGQLQPLPTPQYVWSHISMHFIKCNLGGSGQIYQVCTFPTFIPLNLSPAVAKLFLDNIHKLHGLPHSIITDRDKVFKRALARVV